MLGNNERENVNEVMRFEAHSLAPGLNLAHNTILLSSISTISTIPTCMHAMSTFTNLKGRVGDP